MTKTKRFGRPREYDLEEMSEKLLEWASKDTSINLCEFSALMNISPHQVLNWTRINEDFCTSYEIAKCWLGARREEYLNKDMLHQAAYNRNANTYDMYQKDEFRDQLKFEYSLKTQAENAISEGDLKRHNALMFQLASLQSARKMASKTKIKDKKS